MESLDIVESVKAASTFSHPSLVKSLKINEGLADSRELIDKNPYGIGWVTKVRSINLKKDIENLMNAQQYGDSIRKLEENSLIAVK